MSSWKRIALIVTLLAGAPSIQRDKAIEAICAQPPEIPRDPITGLPAGTPPPDPDAETLKKLCIVGKP